MVSAIGKGAEQRKDTLDAADLGSPKLNEGPDLKVAGLVFDSQRTFDETG